MVKPYRIKHKASGLYYQHYNRSNLGKDGKVYYTSMSPITINQYPLYITIRHSSSVYKRLRDMLAKYVIGKDDKNEWGATSYWIPKSEFEKEEL